MRGRLTTVVVYVSDRLILNEIPCTSGVSRLPISGTLAVGQLRVGQSRNTSWSLIGVRS